uniref:Uncharacterized protein n=1 Tax=Manihot esculenta TaxID=3983 RepID=A0A2C9U6S3_MANES
MESMSRSRVFSSPDLAPPSPTKILKPEEYSLEEHNGASTSDNRKMQRIAGMITILDDCKSRIEKSQSSKKRLAELRRCNTELRPMPMHSPRVRERKPQDGMTSSEDNNNDRLRRQLSSSYNARKSLEIMCSSLGKEKEIMAGELAKKVSELNEMEELVNDLKAQNGTLLTKLQSQAAEKETSAGDNEGNAELQDRNKELSEQLLRSLDSYRSLKRKYRDVKEENSEILRTMEEIGWEVSAGLEQIRIFRQKVASSKKKPADIDDDISALEHMFKEFNMKISKHEEKNTDSIFEIESECDKPKAKISSNKPSVLA